MFSIYKKEVSTFFNSLVGYLAIGIFLLITGLLLWVFPDTSILEYGYATLEGFFSLAPYLFMFLIPAITMRSIAGERQEGTFELLGTRPISNTQLLLGKYFGSLTIVLLVLLPTGVYYYSVYQLGNPVGNIDTGAVIGSYIGLLLLGAAFTAIGILTSALSQNPVVAFLLAIFGCFFGFYAFGAIGGLPFFHGAEQVMDNIGMQAHYEALSRGVLDTYDVSYFISLIFLTLFITLRFLTRTARLRTKRLLHAIAVIIVIVVANWLASVYFTRIDFTQEKRYTLSDLSKETAKNLIANLHITVFLEGDMPAGFNRLRRATADLLADLKAYSGGRLTFTFINPVDGDSRQQEENMHALMERGLAPTNLNVRTESGFMQRLIVPGALIAFGDQEIAVNLLQNRTGVPHEQVLNNSVQNLEYAFVSAIRKLTAGEWPLVGFTEGHGELDDLQLRDAIHSLTDGYQVGRVDLKRMAFDGLDQLDVLIVAKPQIPFTEAEKYKINYFVMNGGRVLWALDQVDASLDSLRTTGEQLVIARQLNLDDLLFTYGIRFNYDLIADMNSAQIPLTVGNIGGQAQIELAPWLFYPIFVPLTDHPVLRNLEGIRSEFAGTIDTLTSPGVHKEIILHSSPFSRLLQIPAPLSLQMVEDIPEPAQFKDQSYPVAALLEGVFPSVFLNRPIPDGVDAAPPVPERSKPTKMLAVADGDVFKGQVNPADGSPYPLGWDRYTEQQYGNRSFLLNAVDYLADDAGIIALRAKEVRLRLLDPVRVRESGRFWQLLNVCLPPLLLFVFGMAQQYLRKRKYSRTN